MGLFDNLAGANPGVLKQQALNQQNQLLDTDMRSIQAQSLEETLQAQAQMQMAQHNAQMAQMQTQPIRPCNHEMVLWCDPADDQSTQPFCVHCKRTKVELVRDELKRTVKA